MLVSRIREKTILLDALTQKDAQFIAVYGRRRVGKTYLIRECLEDRFVFAHAGVYKGDYDEQLTAFSQSLSDYGLVDFEKPKNWMEAFHLLKRVIEASPKRKKVLFLDELSWMSTRNSGLVKALEHFWNGYLSAKKNVLLVVCASATSWILSNIVHNKGGLYGRLTDEISLKPFTLKETEEYVEYRRLGYSKRQILEGYMVLGGIPFYWDKMRKGLSLASNIDRLFVGDEAPLRKEHDYLFKALFDHPEVYIKIVQALASGARAGMDYTDLLKETGEDKGGDFSDKIDELEECGFVRKYTPFGKKSRGTLIQLIDNFTLFYHKFLNPFPTDPHFFSDSLESGSWRAWSGLAFERVCLQHVSQIKEALRIGGVRTEVCSFQCQADEKRRTEGSQIDLLVVRKDDTINLCEMKFSNKPYSVTEEDVDAMETKRSDLIAVTETEYAIMPTLIVFPKVKKNAYSDEYSAIIEAESLFLL